METAPSTSPPIPPQPHRRPPPIRTVTDFIRDCHDRYFITLTTKQALAPEAMSREVSETLHRVNSRLFGNAYGRRRQVRLATYAVQERTYLMGLHTHLLVGVPDGSLKLKVNPCPTPVPDLIVETWISLGDHGSRRAKAQDARPIFDLRGAVGYMHKDILSLEHLDALDLLNTFAPTTASCPGDDRDNPTGKSTSS